MVQQRTRVVSKKEEKRNSEGGRRLVVLGLISLQALLTVATINSFFSGLVDMAQFLFGLNLFAFAGLLYVFKKTKKEKSTPSEILESKSWNFDKAYLG